MNDFNTSAVVPSIPPGTAHFAITRQEDPITAVIALIAAIIGLFSGAVNYISAMVGAVTKPRKPNTDVGPPSTLWMRLGYDNLENANGDPPLIGASGPPPIIMTFDAAGEQIGTSFDAPYLQQGAWNGIPVWALDKKKLQQADFVLISFSKDHDPMCVVDIGISKDTDKRPESHGGWNSLTGKTCAMGSWYHSGWRKLKPGKVPPKGPKDPKDKDDIGQPCIWMGGYGVKSLQFHLPSHSLLSKDATNVNSTIEATHEYFCNSPAKMSFWEDGPQRSELRQRLNVNIHQHGSRTLQETRDRAKGDNKFPGEADPKARSIANRAIHADVLSIGHLNRPGFLAEELCSHGTSEGPDWVNEHEGKFCDMATRTLYDVCTEDLRDDCFDMGLKDVVKNGVVKRAIPYSRERHYG